MAFFVVLVAAAVLIAIVLGHAMGERHFPDDTHHEVRAWPITRVDRPPPPRNPGPFLNSYRPEPDPRSPTGVPSPLLPPRPTLSAGNANVMEDTELHVV